MRAQRLLLLAGALLVVGLVLGLVYALRDDSPARAPAPPPRAEVRPPAQAAPVRRSEPASATPDARPAAPTRLEPEETVDEKGRVIRDHRASPGVPPPNPFAAGTIAGARQAVNLTMKACVSALPLLDAPVHITVHSTMRVRGSRMTASEVSIDGAAPLGPEYEACVKRAFQALSTDTPAEQAEAEERVHMPFTVP